MAPAPKNLLSGPLLVAWLCFFCDYLLMTMQIPLFPLLNKPPTLIGLLFASKALAQILSTPFFINLIDHNPKWVLVFVGLILEMCCLVLFMLDQSFWVWLVGRALSGIAAQFIVSSGMAALSEFYREGSHLRNRAMSVATTGILVGVCCGPVYGGVLHNVNARLPYIVLIVVEVGVAALALRMHHSSSSSGEEEQAESVREKTGVADVEQEDGSSCSRSSGVSAGGPSWGGVEENAAGGPPRRGEKFSHEDIGVSRSTCPPELSLTEPRPLEKTRKTKAPQELVSPQDTTTISNLQILSAPAALWPLIAIVIANATIAALESAGTSFFRETFGFGPAEVGAYFMFTSVPCCLTVVLSPYLAKARTMNSKNVLLVGNILQGFGMVLGPKNSVVLGAVSLVVAGLGMGFVDGISPALLGEVTDREFGGSSRIFVLNTCACQLGFVVGPLVGNLIYSEVGYVVFCYCFGAAQVAFGMLYGWCHCLPGKNGRGKKDTPETDSLI